MFMPKRDSFLLQSTVEDDKEMLKILKAFYIREPVKIARVTPSKTDYSYQLFLEYLNFENFSHYIAKELETNRISNVTFIRDEKCIIRIYDENYDSIEEEVGTFSPAYPEDKSYLLCCETGTKWILL